MWYTLRRSPKADPDFASSANELLQSTSRNLILATSGVYLIWQLLVADELPGQLGPAFVPITAVIVLTCVLSLRLLRKWLLAAQAVWQVGVAAAITLTICLFRHPEIAFLYALLPLMAVVTLGWPAGLLAEGLVIGLLWWLVHSSAMLPLSNSYAIAITASGVLTGLVGWAAMHTLLTATQWALFSFEQARQKIEEAREQRLELKQIQQDLIQANGELARLSDRLKAMHRAAEEARRAKEEFVANVSHELRTPLNMIIGFSEMIIQSPQVYGARLPSALLADITAIRRNSQHLAKLVDDVLDLSQVEAGRMALSKEWVSLQGIVDEVATAVRGLYESKGLYLQTEVPADLPPILCDSTRIRQVMLNLLSNAGRFTERGGVRLNAWREKDNVVVSVSDTGPGIAPEDQEKIFEPFQQLDGSIRRRHGGSGLGLSISKRFVEMHRGKMWLESEVGVGTTFYFSLPLEMPLPAALTGGDDARRWFSPYHGYEFRVRTRRSKAPAPVLVPRYVIVEEGETLQHRGHSFSVY
jgi:signal transduction histidine kinase